MNLLDRGDAWDDLIRIKSESVAYNVLYTKICLYVKNKSKKRSFTSIITLQDKTKMYSISKRSIDGKF